MNTFEILQEFNRRQQKDGTVELTIDLLNEALNVYNGPFNCPFPMKIYPAVANYILTNKNKNNRKITTSTVVSLERQMRDNMWKFNGENIIFTQKGNLADGQHRLSACKNSNIPFVTTVTFGVDYQTMHTLDTGKMRSSRDVISLRNHDLSDIHALIKQCYYDKHGKYDEHGAASTRVRAMSNSEVDKYVESHFDKFMNARRYVDGWKKCIKNWSIQNYYKDNITSLGGYCLYRYVECGEEINKIDDFVRIVCDGRTPERIGLHFANWLQPSNKMKRTPGEKFAQYDVMWNEFIQGKINRSKPYRTKAK